MSELTVAQHLMAAFHRRGTRRVFGVPGGGSSLDLIAAAEALGMVFVLARAENAAVMMAAADADLTGAPGVALTTKGPGLAHAMNGLAHAALDRAPVALITDGFSEALASYVTHQVFDQTAMTAPVVKAHSRLEGEDTADEIEQLIDLMMAPTRGPVHLELTGTAARRLVPERTAMPTAQGGTLPDLEAAHAILSRARRPVIVAGLEARRAAPELIALAEAMGAPVLTSYKAKGVIAESHPQRIGLFTGGAAEGRAVRDADLILLAGLDPVELILQPWPYDLPVLALAEARHRPQYTTPEVEAIGPLAPMLSALIAEARRSDWTLAEIAEHRDRMRAATGFATHHAQIGTQADAAQPLTPQGIVEMAAIAHPGARATVDAGAHMFSATGFWPADAPNDVQISNGLASMAFALPAGIATALAEPNRRCIAFTGDGGLMMCIGELATAAQYGAPVTVIVFNDGALSLIDLKQRQRQMKRAGVFWPRVDFAAIARGFGCTAWRADTVETYAEALAQAARTEGPALIDVLVDPSGYAAQLKEMRG